MTVVFDLPVGASVPDGVKEGDDFEATATFKLLPNDRVELVSFDDMPVGEDEEGENESGSPEGEGFLGAIERQAGAK